MDEKPAVNYPITVYRFGKVPLKAPGKNLTSGKSSAMPLMDVDFSEDFSDFGSGSSFTDEDDDVFDEDEEESYEDDFFDEGDEEL